MKDADRSVESCLAKDRFAAQSGVELVFVAPGQARAKLTLKAHHLNGVGIVQGGAIFTLADFAFAAASNSYGTIALAINVNISFIKSVRGGVLWADAREVSRNPKLGTYTVTVKDEALELVALFQGMVYRKKDLLPM